MKLNHYICTPQFNGERFIFATFLAKLQAVKSFSYLPLWLGIRFSFYITTSIKLSSQFCQCFLKNHLHVTNWWCGCPQPRPHMQYFSTRPYFLSPWMIQYRMQISMIHLIIKQDDKYPSRPTFCQSQSPQIQTRTTLYIQM